MKYTGKELKCRARESMKGNYSVPILATVGIAMFAFLFTCITTALFGANGTFSMVLNQLSSLIFSLILSVFTAGIWYIYLNIGRKKPYSMNDIFYMFHQNPDRVIVVCFVLTLINMVCSTPVYMTQGLVTRIDTPEKLLQVFPVVMGSIFLSMVLTLFVTLPFAFSYMLLIDNPEMSAGEALKGSVLLLKGNKMRLCRLYISFLGMGILVVLSGFAAYIWVQAYMQATMVQFYMELNGEMEQARQEEEPKQEVESLGPAQMDDYNAEA